MSWRRIEAWEKKNLPGSKRDRKRRGATKKQCEAAAVLGLPADFLHAMAQTNGSNSKVFGEWNLLQIEQIDPRQLTRGGTLTVTTRTDGPVQPVYAHQSWIPFAYNGAGDHLCLDLAPAAGGTPGQVVEFWHDDPVRRVLAPSFTAWLDQVATRLESGELVWDEGFDAVRESGASVSAPDLDRVIAAFTEAITDLAKTRTFSLPGLGSLSLSVSPAFDGQMGGGTIRVPRRVMPSFAFRETDGDASWIEASGLTVDQVRLALQPIADAVVPSVKKVRVPGLGELIVFENLRRTRLDLESDLRYRI